MGNCLLLLGLKKEKRPVTLLLVGLDSAGKTTAAKGIVGDPVEDVAPTVGFAPESLEYRGCEVTIYDLGGGAKIRPVWAKYFSEVHGVIFVVDSSAGGRVEECQSVLQALLSHPKIAGKPVLILANKQDVDGALDEIDLVEGLKVEEIVNKYKCPTRVETCSAIATRNRKPDKPIADGFRWLVDTIVVHYKEINKRVERDLEREREQQRRELEARKERLNQLRLQREIDARLQEGGRGRCTPPPPSPTPPQASSTPSPPPPPSTSAVTVAEVEKSDDIEPTSSNLPNGALPQAKRKVRITSPDHQELNELGFESSGELANSTSSNCSTSSSSTCSTSSLVKVPATTTTTTTTTMTSPPPPKVILVKQSSPHTTPLATPSPKATPLNNAGQLELSSERRKSECIPIDSDDDLFDLDLTNDLTSVTLGRGVTPHQENNYMQNGGAHHNANSHLELESGNRPSKKKSFLRRYNRTAPLLANDFHTQQA